MDPVTKRLVPMPDTMRLLGDLGRTKLYELIKDGEITKVKIGSRSFVTAESLDAYLERLVEGAHGRSAGADSTAGTADDAGERE
jgi:excisionase family DNA binding protein